VLRPFIQQGTQLVSMFGPLGAVAGAAGAIIGAVAVSLTRTGDAAKETQSSYDLLLETTKQLNEQSEISIDLGKKETLTRLEQAKAINIQAQASLASLASEVTAREAELNRLKGDLEATQSAAFLAGTEGALSSIGGDIAAKEAELAALRDRIAEVGGALDTSSADIASFTEHLDEVTTGSKSAAGAIVLQIEANQKLAAALRKGGDEYEIVSEQLKIMADDTDLTASEARQLAKELVKSRGTVDALLDTSKAADKAAESHKKLTENVAEQIAENERLIAALRISEAEYETVARTLDLMGQGFQGTESEARKYAETLLAQENQLKTLQDGYDSVRKAAEDAAKESARDWERATDNIQDGFADILFEGKDAAETLKNVFKRSFAEIASAAFIRPVIAPIVQDARGFLGGGAAAGGITVPGFGGGQVGGGGFGLDSIVSVGSNLLNGGLFSSTLAGFGREFATSGIGQALGLSQALPRGGSIGLTGAGGAFAKAAGNLPYAGIGALLGGAFGLGSGNFLIDTGLSTVGGLAGGALGAEIAALGAFGGPIGAALGGLAGVALGSLFKGKPSEGETLEARLGGTGNIVAVGVDNGGDRVAAQQLAEDFQTVVEAITGITGGNFGSGFRVSNSARSGLRLDAGGSWLHFGTPNELVNYLIDTQLTGGDAALTRAARLSSASTIDGIIADLQTAQHIQAIISTANDNLSPLEQAIEAVNEQFGNLIDKGRELGFDTQRLVQLREEEIAALKEQDRIQSESLRLRAEAGVLTAVGGASRTIADFVAAERFSATSSLGIRDQLSEAERQFGVFFDSVHGEGNLFDVQPLLGAAERLLGLGQQAYGATPDYGRVREFTLSQLDRVNEQITSDSFINDKVASAVDINTETTAEGFERLQEEVRQLKNAVRTMGDKIADRIAS
jgi:hypothetical protein